MVGWGVCAPLGLLLVVMEDDRRVYEHADEGEANHVSLVRALRNIV